MERHTPIDYVLSHFQCPRKALLHGSVVGHCLSHDAWPHRFPGLNKLPSSLCWSVIQLLRPWSNQTHSAYEAVQGQKGMLVLSPFSALIFLYTRSKLTASLAHVGAGALRYLDASSKLSCKGWKRWHLLSSYKMARFPLYTNSSTTLYLK